MGRVVVHFLWGFHLYNHDNSKSSTVTKWRKRAPGWELIESNGCSSINPVNKSLGYAYNYIPWKSNQYYLQVGLRTNIFYSKGLSWSKESHHFFYMVVDFQGKQHIFYNNSVETPCYQQGLAPRPDPSQKMRNLCFMMSVCGFHEHCGGTKQNCTKSSHSNPLHILGLQTPWDWR